MPTLKERIVQFLPYVSTPGQYIGREWNMVKKDLDKAEVSFVLAFPDTYAVGMSHLGIKILYSLLNEIPWVAAERTFAPWVDMEEYLRREKIPLFTLESFAPVRSFDLVGFSLQYEMGYSTLLNMLDLAGIPIWAQERTSQDPLILAGGCQAFAPEPVSPFVDLFLLGDGEEQILDLVQTFRTLKKEGVPDRWEIIRSLAIRNSSLYAPSLYEPEVLPGSRILRIRPKEEAVPAIVHPAAVQDLDKCFFPEAPLLPNVKTIHDRINIEIMRGCVHGCRFCQAAVIKRPVRYRSKEKILELAEKNYRATGYDEIALTSLSSSDYPGLEDLLHEMVRRFSPLKVGISFPSLRINRQIKILPLLIGSVRKSGLTLAPEAARDELRRLINKDVRNEDLFAGLLEAYRQGWQLVKLYFMTGLPGETDEDIEGIAEMAIRSSLMRKKVGLPPARIHVSLSAFVPKPFTPFQWEPMVSPERIREVQRLLLDRIRRHSVRLTFNLPHRSYLEGILARGDRRLAPVIFRAWQEGARFDAWDEHFHFSKWMKAFEEEGIDPDEYVLRTRERDEIFPWDHLGGGISKAFLLEERERTLQGIQTPPCKRDSCHECGAGQEKCP